MIDQLVWIELLLKGGSGLALLIMPGVINRFLGLPRLESGYWPRLFGAMMVGVALAMLADVVLAGRGARGLGMAGAVIVNTTGSLGLIAVLIAGDASCVGWTRWATAALLAALVTLTMIEIAWA